MSISPSGSSANLSRPVDRLLRRTAFFLGALSIVVAAIPSLRTHFSDLTTDLATAELRDVNAQTSAQDVVAPAASATPDNSEMLARASMKLAAPPEVRNHLLAPSFDRENILKDFENRIGDDFAIPEGLHDRVGFWFDVYTIFDSNKKIIHHALYPWIIFKVIDVEPIVNASFPRRRWMRNEVANSLVKKELANVRKALTSLTKKKRPRDLEASRLTPDEILVRNALEQLQSPNAEVGSKIKNRVANRPLWKIAVGALREVRVQTGQRDFMAEGIQTSPRYMTAMEEIFRSHKLPTELTRLPLVESSFNKHAQSKVGAMGVWQFMESSGKKQKLVVNDIVDERKSVFKSTHAAASQLKENHLILYRSWPLAVTAWNHGPGGVRKAYRATKTKDLPTIIEFYHSKRFGFATENFFTEFLAALYTEKYSDRIFPGLPKHAPLLVTEIRIAQPTSVEDILRVAAITADEFLSINPDLIKLVRRTNTLRSGLRIHIPKDAIAAVESLMNRSQEKRRVVGMKR